MDFKKQSTDWLLKFVERLEAIEWDKLNISQRMLYGKAMDILEERGVK